MAISVFISATSDDLPDCRASAIRAIGNKAVPVTMETWTTEYGDPVEVCRQKVCASDKYLGIFAYRRGWTPPDLRPPKSATEKSITEAELEWAQGAQKAIAVLVPNPAKPFAAELRQRAVVKQTAAETAAQEAFLKRVDQLGTRMAFDDLAHLEGRVADIINSWLYGGLRSLPAVEPQPQPVPQPQPAPPVSPPSRDEIVLLGREEQVRAFEDGLKMLVRRKLPAAACFLIHGGPGAGHKEMARRLHLALKTEPRRYAAAISPSWRQTDVRALVEVLGSEVERGWVADSPAALAARLVKILEVDDVLLDIRDLQRLDGGLPAFAADFWQPLAAAVGSPSHRLIALAGYERKLPDERSPLLYDPADVQAVFAGGAVIKLPELAPFTAADVEFWLQDSMKLARQQAGKWAGVLIEETEEGRPSLLYRKLEEDTSWRS
jgi:hypothetical protein